MEYVLYSRADSASLWEYSVAIQPYAPDRGLVTVVGDEAYSATYLKGARPGRWVSCCILNESGEEEYKIVGVHERIED